ncbi:MAG: HDIG domain-containing protein, partial [Clostridia bacterium]|nr:HDIG domain-containing protein [Clostridia bacterium]
YRYQEGVTESVLSQFDQIFSQLRVVRQYGETLDSENGQYTREELDYAATMLTQITLRDYQLSTLLSTDQASFDELYDSLYSAIKNTMSGNVTEGQESEAIQNISMIVGYRTDTDLLQNIVIPVLRSCIQPNMVIDQEATENARNEARNAVEAVVYKQGQNIVVKGEGRITVNQIAMLNTLGLLNSSEADITFYLGGALFVIICMVIYFLLLNRVKPQLTHDYKRLLLMSLILLITMLLCVLVKTINVYAIPVIMAAILLTAVESPTVGLYANALMAVLIAGLTIGSSSSVSEEMIQIFVSASIGGPLAALMMGRGTSRLRAMLSGLIGAVVSFAIVTCLGLLTTSAAIDTVLGNAAWCMTGALLSGVLTAVFQPLLEMMFNLPTPMRLLELSNPNQPLLKKLMMEAPGTYHHSILVANLAEASAEAIGANPLLARCGAYYHDIGKLKRPLYFSENQSGTENVHDHTDPLVSAKILTAHPRDGVVLARQYHLPTAIQSIIAQHHGNSPVMYFYHKAVQQSGGKPVDINEFRYDGDRPSSKEAAIIMICDTVEAAVRSLKGAKSPEELEDYIVKLVRGKLSDGQLNSAPLTLSDIDAICSACATVLRGVNHERVAYPTDKTGGKRLFRKKEPAVTFTDRAAQTPSSPEKTITPDDVEKPEPILEATSAQQHDLFISPQPTEAPVVLDDILEDGGDEKNTVEIETENAPAFLHPSDMQAEEPAAGEMTEKPADGEALDEA